ncbi:MAG: ribonuclease III [Anaerorhabdus sp.]
MMTIIAWLKQRGIEVKNESLIIQAFMHSSYVNEHRSKNDNERLEFMGDAVLQLWISDKIFRIEPSLDEGHMTTLRAQLVCEKALAIYAKELKLNEFLLLGSGEEKSGGRQRDSIVSDMFEAFLGALFMDGGMEYINNILDEVITPRLQDPNQVIVMDYKTKLQEFVQSDTRKTVTYEVIKMTGPSNNPRFEIQVKLDDIILGKGIGNSKKKAEQMAAKDAFEKLVK